MLYEEMTCKDCVFYDTCTLAFHSDGKKVYWKNSKDNIGCIIGKFVTKEEEDKQKKNFEKWKGDGDYNEISQQTTHSMSLNEEVKE